MDMTYISDNRKLFTQSMLGHCFTIPNHISVKSCLQLGVAAHACNPGSVEAEREDLAWATQ